MQFRAMSFLVFAFALLTAHDSLGVEPLPKRSSSALTRPVAEETWKVKTARVVLADYALIRRDFSFLKDRSKTEIDQFILNQAGYVSIPQAQKEGVNTPISVDPLEKKKALRPEYYGRALVFPVEGEEGQAGLFDVKGSGSLQPMTLAEEAVKETLTGHRNGLASTGECIREFVMQKAVQKVLEHAHSDYNTVGSYAVIDWGFAIHSKDGPIPAGAVVRQGHSRRLKATHYDRELKAKGVVTKNHFLGRSETLEVERTLRKYGITSAHPSDETPRHLLDIQGTQDKRLVDFGTYTVRSDFSDSSYWYPERKLTAASPLIAPSDVDYVHPDPKVRLPLYPWGSSESGVVDSKYDNLYIWAHRVSKSFSEGRAQRSHILQTVNLFLEQSLPAELRASVCGDLLRSPHL